MSASAAEPSDRSSGAPFLQTLPGILTGIAAIVTAAGAFVAVVVHSQDSPTAKPAPVTTPAPGSPDGVVARAWVASTRSGAPTKGIDGPVKNVWAQFTFSTLPTAAAAPITVSWQGPDGKAGARIEKERARTIVAHYSAPRPLARGKWHVFLRVGDEIVKDIAFVVSGRSDRSGPVMSIG